MTLDGARYLSIARAVPRVTGQGLATIVLGCEEKHGPRILYGDALSSDVATPIGAACHVCLRHDCADRSLPPVTRALDLHPYQRQAAPYPFRVT